MAVSDSDFQALARAIRDLTRRVEQLEQRLSHDFIAQPSAAALKDMAQSTSGLSAGGLESRIGSQWLNRIGVIAVLFGVAYLLRFIFLSNWISAPAWIWMGASLGVVIIIVSEWFRRGGYRVLSLSLKATGIGISYLSLWAGLELYKLVSGAQAFVGLVFLAGLTAALALRESAEVLAALALIAGFFTPLLISIPSADAPLFTYMILLDSAAAVLSLARRWWKLLPLSFLGTVLLYGTWYVRTYSRSEPLMAVFATTLFFAIFCATAALLRPQLSRTPRLLTLLEIVNPTAYLSALYLVRKQLPSHVLVFPTLCLSTLYFILARKSERSARCAGPTAGLYGGLGIASGATALSAILQLDWLSLGWFLEAAAVIAIGFWRNLPWLRWGALLLLCAAVVKAFAFDIWQLSLGYRTLSFIGLGVLLLVLSFAYQRYGFVVIARDDKNPLRSLR
jgi:uncharacterized membrane protein